MDQWNALPDDLKRTLEKTVRESFVPLTREVMKEDEKVFNTTKMTVDTLSPEDAAKLKAYAIEAWDSEIATKGPLGAKAVKIIKDYYSIK